MRTHKSIILIVFKKWWLILLTGIIISAGLVYEKAVATNYVIKSGDVWFTKIISIENFQLLTHYDEVEKFKYPSYMKNYRSINTFINDTEVAFDYEKFCLNWDKKSKLQKFKWVQDHFIINDFGGGIYELCFVLGNNEPKELDYVLQNGSRYLEKYYSFSKTDLAKLDNDIRFKEISDFKVLPQEEKKDKYDVIKKYAIIGFILGILGATLGIMINCLRKVNVGR